MSATLRVWKAFEVVINGHVVAGGSRSKPVEITVAGSVLDDTKSMADSTTWTAWTTGSGVALTDFDYLYIESDQDVWLELTADVGAEVGTVVFAKQIKANEPFDLLHDDAYANYTANFGSGTADVVDRVRIRNISGNTANVRVVLVT